MRLTRRASLLTRYWLFGAGQTSLRSTSPGRSVWAPTTAFWLRWRAGETPIRVENWRSSADGYGAFSRSAIPTIKALFGHKELVLATSSQRAPPKTASFDITGV